MSSSWVITVGEKIRASTREPKNVSFALFFCSIFCRLAAPKPWSAPLVASMSQSVLEEHKQILLIDLGVDEALWELAAAMTVDRV